MIDLEWWKLCLLTFVYYLVFNIIFGILFWIDIQSLGHASGYSDAFFFSIQTMSTIGYGNYVPNGWYVNSVVFVEAWLSLLTDGIVLALIIAKIARPTRLRRTIEFSTCAVINKSMKSFSPDNQQCHPTGKYVSEEASFSFRVMNLRDRPLCEPNCAIILFIKEDGKYVIYEMDFEIHRQNGRIRAINFSRPYLNLPWTVVHKIDSTSPLFGKSPEDLINQEAEIIAIISGIDELSAAAFQTRWSYTAQDLKFGHHFVEMVTRKNGTITIEFQKLSQTAESDKPSVPPPSNDKAITMSENCTNNNDSDHIAIDIKSKDQ